MRCDKISRSFLLSTWKFVLILLNQFKFSLLIFIIDVEKDELLIEKCLEISYHLFRYGGLPKSELM